MAIGSRLYSGLVVGMFMVFATTSIVGQDDGANVGFERFWFEVQEVMEQVQQKHPLPPTQQEMIVRGLSALDPANLPANYPAIVQKVSTTAPDQLRAVCLESWKTHIENGSQADSLRGRFITGLLTSVPGEARWIPAEEARVTQQLQENRYVGIGISLRWNSEEDVSELVEVFYGGPAWTAKLEAGDKIVEVDGESAKGVGLGTVIQQLRGPLETDLTIKVDRKGEIIKADMTRLEVPIATVEGVERQSVERWRIKFEEEQQLGYVRLVRIAGSTAAELRSVLRQAQEQKCQGLILDLRTVQPGDFHQTLMVADVLFDEGVIGRRMVGGRTEELRSATPGLWTDRPWVILTSGATRAEIVWLVEALGQRENVKILGWPLVVDGFQTEMVTLKSGGLLENLPSGFLLTEPREISLQEQPPGVVPRTLTPGRAGQIAMIPDERIQTSSAPASFDAGDTAVQAAIPVLIQMIDESDK